jgi:hypothetical protein
MKDILVIVSTCNRRDLTGITLNSLKRCLSPASDVIISDDNSECLPMNWLLNWGWPVERCETRMGVGKAALLRYTRFLQSPEHYRYLCATDNDLLFGAQFDYRLRQLWEATRSTELTVITGYHSVTQIVLEDHGDWQVVDGVGGAVQFVDRKTAAMVINTMPSSGWGRNWDHCISKIFERKITTKRSLVEHLGIHGDGVNGLSTDVAHDFVGENLW